MITQNRLKEVLNYNKETGLFVWLVSKGNVKKGETAGSNNGKGYLRITIDGECYRLHRLAWLYSYGEFPIFQIDHKNQIKTDNRINNLRVATNQMNHKNMPKYKNNTSGITGVRWNKKDGKYHSKIYVLSKYIHLGSFDTELAATYARHCANIKYGFHENHGKPKSI